MNLPRFFQKFAALKFCLALGCLGLGGIAHAKAGSAAPATIPEGSLDLPRSLIVAYRVEQEDNGAWKLVEKNWVAWNFEKNRAKRISLILHEGSSEDATLDEQWRVGDGTWRRNAALVKEKDFLEIDLKTAWEKKKSLDYGLGYETSAVIFSDAKRPMRDAYITSFIEDMAAKKKGARNEKGQKYVSIKGVLLPTEVYREYDYVRISYPLDEEHYLDPAGYKLDEAKAVKTVKRVKERLIVDKDSIKINEGCEEKDLSGEIPTGAKVLHAK